MLMPTIIGDGSFHSFPGQSIVCCNLSDIAANTVQVRNNRPHRDAITLDTSGVRTGIIWILLNIARDQLVIFHLYAPLASSSSPLRHDRRCILSSSTQVGSWLAPMPV